jgi:hypothetical protein
MTGIVRALYGGFPSRCFSFSCICEIRSPPSGDLGVRPRPGDVSRGAPEHHRFEEQSPRGSIVTSAGCAATRSHETRPGHRDRCHEREVRSYSCRHTLPKKAVRVAGVACVTLVVLQAKPAAASETWYRWAGPPSGGRAMQGALRSASARRRATGARCRDLQRQE